MNRLVMPRSACQANSSSPGPVAAEADLRVARRVDLAVVHQGAHEGSVGELHAEHLFSGVGVSVEVHDADRPARGHTRAHARLGNRVVAAQQHGRRAGGEHLPHHALDRGVRTTRVAGQYRRVAEIHDPELREGIHAGLQVRARRTARRADRARREARPGAVGDEVIHRCAHDRHVHALELGRVLGVRTAGEGEQPRVVRLLADRRPAVEWIDQVRPA
jgi:hypothetical protein